MNSPNQKPFINPKHKDLIHDSSSHLDQSGNGVQGLLSNSKHKDPKEDKPSGLDQSELEQNNNSQSGNGNIDDSQYCSQPILQQMCNQRKVQLEKDDSTSNVIYEPSFNHSQTKVFEEIQGSLNGQKQKKGVSQSRDKSSIKEEKSNRSIMEELIDKSKIQSSSQQNQRYLQNTKLNKYNKRKNQKENPKENRFDQNSSSLTEIFQLWKYESQFKCTPDSSINYSIFNSNFSLSSEQVKPQTQNLRLYNKQDKALLYSNDIKSSIPSYLETIQQKRNQFINSISQKQQLSQQLAELFKPLKAGSNNKQKRDQISPFDQNTNKKYTVEEAEAPLRKSINAVPYSFRQFISQCDKNQFFKSTTIQKCAKLNDLGQSILKKRYTGHVEEAITCFKKCHQLQLQIYDQNSLDVGITFNNFGRSYYLAGKYDKALEMYKKSKTIYQQYLPQSLELAKIQQNIGLLQNKLAEQFKKKKNEILQGESIDTVQKLNKIGISNSSTEYYCYQQAQDYYGKSLNESKEYQHYQQALDSYEKGLKIKTNVMGPESIDVARALHKIGIVNYNKGQYQKALDNYNKSLEIHNTQEENKSVQEVQDLLQKIGNVHIVNQDMKQLFANITQRIDNMKLGYKKNQNRILQATLEIMPTAWFGKN